MSMRYEGSDDYEIINEGLGSRVQSFVDDPPWI